MNQILIIEPNEFWEEFDKRMSEFFAGKEKNTSKWMRSADVRELLNISDSTLQAMRISRALPAYKLSNTWFYRYDEIMDALENGKIQRR